VFLKLAFGNLDDVSEAFDGICKYTYSEVFLFFFFFLVLGTLRYERVTTKGLWIMLRIPMVVTMGGRASDRGDFWAQLVEIIVFACCNWLRS
jgi:hypothetical protein